MAEYKYPFIKGGKAMVAATLGACRYIRDTGYFNKAIRYYAEKYGVDVKKLEKNVRERQAAGQKGKTRKYKWFAVEYSMGNERNGVAYFDETSAVYGYAKGVSVESVKARLSKYDDYLSEYSPCHWFGRVTECENEQNAKTTAEQWAKENLWAKEKLCTKM